MQSGLMLDTGLSLFPRNGYAGMRSAGLGRGGGYSPAPNAGTATQQGFGTIAGAATGSGRAGHSMRVTYGVLSTGTVALALLVYTWWSLPR